MPPKAKRVAACQLAGHQLQTSEKPRSGTGLSKSSAGGGRRAGPGWEASGGGGDKEHSLAGRGCLCPWVCQRMASRVRWRREWMAYPAAEWRQ